VVFGAIRDASILSRRLHKTLGYAPGGNSTRRDRRPFCSAYLAARRQTTPGRPSRGWRARGRFAKIGVSQDNFLADRTARLAGSRAKGSAALPDELIPPDSPPVGTSANGNGDRFEPLNIEDELKDSYLTYAMSVIISRALPDVRDGLKPSQRRILVAMSDLGLGPTGATSKCAGIVGETMKRYHPHGEGTIYPTLVRLAQDWAMRHRLVHPQGNFGSIAGLPAAAMRYTEARLSPVAAEMLQDLERDTVDYIDNYDGKYREPLVLPSKFPNLLVNGSDGIAVGMATEIPPHNLGEVCNGLIKLIDEPETTFEELLE